MRRTRRVESLQDAEQRQDDGDDDDQADEIDDAVHGLSPSDRQEADHPRAGVFGGVSPDRPLRFQPFSDSAARKARRTRTHESATIRLAPPNATSYIPASPAEAGDAVVSALRFIPEFPGAAQSGMPLRGSRAAR